MRTEIMQEAKAYSLTLFRVKLGRKAIPLPDGASKGLAV